KRFCRDFLFLIKTPVRSAPGSDSWKRRLKCYNNFKKFPFPPWQPPAIYGTRPCHDFRMEDTK
ncbi:MAG: hypothetical protein ACLTAC_31170, partial [Hungatella sp.]